MTSWTRFGTPDMDLEEAAAILRESGWRSLPVVQDALSGMPIGMILDRSISAYLATKEINLRRIKVRDCMRRSRPWVIGHEASLEGAARMMAEKKARQFVVVDGQGKCCGLIFPAQLGFRAKTGKDGQAPFHGSGKEISPSVRR